MKEILNKKGTSGISLVALIVTIIVLIILTAAVIITFMEGGIIDRAKKAVFRSDIRNYQDILLVKNAERKIDRETGKETEELLNADTLEEIQAIIPEFKKEYEDLVIIEDGKLVLGTRSENPYATWLADLGIEAGSGAGNSGIGASAGETSTAQWIITEDKATTGLSLGDLLTPTVTGKSNEKFYVIADNGTTLTLIAERCIDTSSNTQDDDYSKVLFDEGEWDEGLNYFYKTGTTILVTNVYANSSIRGLVKDYVDTLTGLDLLDVEEAYGGTAVSGRKGRLMWKEEVEDETFTAVTNYSDILYGPTAARIDYWLGSPVGSPYDYTGWVAYEVIGNEQFVNLATVNLDFQDKVYGIRPVIKILKSKVEV